MIAINVLYIDKTNMAKTLHKNPCPGGHEI